MHLNLRRDGARDTDERVAIVFVALAVIRDGVCFVVRPRCVECNNAVVRLCQAVGGLASITVEAKPLEMPAEAG